MTYPHEIFRRIEVPFAWLEKPEFLEIRQHFFSRFVLDYHKRDDESFQICTREACEVAGKGIEKFQATFQSKEQLDA